MVSSAGRQTAPHCAEHESKPLNLLSPSLLALQADVVKRRGVRQAELLLRAAQPSHGAGRQACRGALESICTAGEAE